MFWRFGFHSSSAIDTILDREDVKLEEILEEEDLLQEAKSHNQKLVEFLCKPENLSKLLHYITAPDLDETERARYPFLSCEIIACEIQQIVDAIVLEHKEILETFWAYLDRPAPPRRRMSDLTAQKTNSNYVDREEMEGLDSVQASYFYKTISVFLTKRTAEMVDFIKSRPENLKKILSHLQTSSIMDLLLILVRMEELQGGKGIVQWLSDHGLLDDLVDRLDPYLDSEEHSVAQQCICEIIRMSQTSLLESPSIGLNDLIVSLKSERVIQKLANFMLDSTAPNATSTLINGVTIIIDLIRHNNSDIESDPMMNGAYGYQPNTVARQTSVSLADMLKVLADHVGDFNNLLIHPRSVSGPMRTTMGEQVPLGFERLKICELFAELLHCSNMSNLNYRPEDVAHGDSDTESLQLYGEHTEKAAAKETHQENNQETASLSDNDSTKDDITKNDSLDGTKTAEENAMASTTSAADAKAENLSADPSASPNPSDASASKGIDMDESENNANTESASQPVQAEGELKVSIGDHLKMQFVEHKVIATCIDLFFAFPWNNFLHYVVYDMLHQIFNGQMDKGYNCHLAISVFRDGKLTDRMVDAQKANDEECAKPKGMRLGYMGHLTFIADEIIKLFEGYPETITAVIKDDVDLQRWYDFCNNELTETKERDHLPLGGPRPNDGMEGAVTDEEEEEDPMEASSDIRYSTYYSQHGPPGTMDEDDEDDPADWNTGDYGFEPERSYGVMFGIGNDNEHFNQIDITHAGLDEDEDENEDFDDIPTESAGYVTLQETQNHVRMSGQANNQLAPKPNQTTADTGKLDVSGDDDFGDLQSSETQADSHEWDASITSGIENVRISYTADSQQQHYDRTLLDQSQPQKDLANDSAYYVPAVKTKEEQDEKLAKDYRPDEEQEGEI